MTTDSTLAQSIAAATQAFQAEQATAAARNEAEDRQRPLVATSYGVGATVTAVGFPPPWWHWTSPAAPKAVREAVKVLEAANDAAKLKSRDAIVASANYHAVAKSPTVLSRDALIIRPVQG